MWKIYRTSDGMVLLQNAGTSWRVEGFSFDELFRAGDAQEYLQRCAADGRTATRLQEEFSLEGVNLLAPVGAQEVWAAGVTYRRSREARMEESERSGADRFYDLVYDADRPELFFKSAGRSVRGDSQTVRIRGDARWSVPEPELALAIDARGRIFGYAVGNDMSSRDIEGENPLYLPQAKVYRGSCALGPCLTVCGPLSPVATGIFLRIERRGVEVFSGSTSLANMKRTPEELAAWLFRENDFPDGCYLLTGTGLVPPADFTLDHGDVVRIEIDGLGVLENTVE
jgi:2-dehydro-3-deoxy-D-arabinonate dehydratase